VRQPRTIGKARRGGFQGGCRRSPVSWSLALVHLLGSDGNERKGNERLRLAGGRRGEEEGMTGEHGGQGA
jgi:hypothetical protein